LKNANTNSLVVVIIIDFSSRFETALIGRLLYSSTLAFCIHPSELVDVYALPSFP
jgi:hypothetical protein